MLREQVVPATALEESGKLLIRNGEEETETTPLIVHIWANPGDYRSMWRVSGVVTDHQETQLWGEVKCHNKL